MPSEAIYPPRPGRLFLALLWNPEFVDIETIKARLAADWGKIKDEFSLLDFPMTHYYQKEMGSHLKRIFLLVEGDFSRESHVFVKKKTMEREKEFADEGHRTVNIDPGVICLEQLLLISTKPYSHRIYVGDNLYGELCYQFSRGHYHTLPWTYPDYSNTNVIKKFEEWREDILKNS